MNTSDLAVGDRFLALDVPVEVLRPQEPWSHLCGTFGCVRHPQTGDSERDTPGGGDGG